MRQYELLVIGIYSDSMRALFRTLLCRTLKLGRRHDNIEGANHASRYPS